MCESFSCYGEDESCGAETERTARHTEDRSGTLSESRINGRSAGTVLSGFVEHGDRGGRLERLAGKAASYEKKEIAFRSVGDPYLFESCALLRQKHTVHATIAELCLDFHLCN
jgi:hypothetical protein